MGKVTGNWITGHHSGRACRHDDIYTRVNRKTGACYSVKLCNPNTNWTKNQTRQRISFGTISAAINAWIKQEQLTDSADYLKVKKMYDRQTRYSTLRGMMYAKGMYTVDEQGQVTVDVNARTLGAIAGGSGSDSGSGGSGGSDSGSGGSSGGSDADIE